MTGRYRAPAALVLVVVWLPVRAGAWSRGHHAQSPRGSGPATGTARYWPGTNRSRLAPSSAAGSTSCSRRALDGRNIGHRWTDDARRWARRARIDLSAEILELEPVMAELPQILTLGQRSDLLVGYHSTRATLA